MSLLTRLKERKLVQWALAYVAGAWVTLQVMDVVAEPLGLTASFQLGILIVVGAGFFGALVLAWYHGEKGHQRVSGPELLMLTAVLGIAGAALAFLPDLSPPAVPDAPPRSRSEVAEDSRPSVAVIPLSSATADEESEIFTQGVHADIITQLSKVRGLRVISRTSVERFKQGDAGVPDIARQLGVDAVMEGSVQRVGSSVRVNTQLIDGVTDEHLWAETYDRPFSVEGLLDLQAEIARSVVAALRATLTAAEEADIRSASTSDPRAYTAYLEALTLSDTRLVTGVPMRAVARLREATGLDPDFHEAWSLLARMLAFAIWYEGVDEEWLQVQNALERAQDLAPEAYETTMAEATVRYYRDADLAGAERAFHMAGELRPGSVEPPFMRGVVAKRQARWAESLELLDVAARLDPLSPLVWGERRFALNHLGRPEEALESLERAISIEPRQYADSRLGLLILLGDTARARAQAVDRTGRWPRTSPHWPLVLDVYLSGDMATLADSLGAGRFLPLNVPFVMGLDGADDVVLLLQRAGRTAEALELADALIRSADGSNDVSDIRRRTEIAFERAAALAVLGDREGSHSALQEALEAAARIDALSAAQVRYPRVASVYLSAGDTLRTLQELETCAPVQCPASVLRLDPWWDPLRDHPRFQALLER